MMYLKGIIIFVLVNILRMSVAQSRNVNNRPIIGVMAQASGKSARKYGDTFISGSYVKFLEMSGARVVPIRTEENDDYYERIFSNLNGALFPGGGVGIISSGYAKGAKKLYDLAVKAAANGDYFPMWGTCQGFQLFSALTSGKDILVTCDSENISLPLDFAKDYRTSRLFKNLPTDLFEAVTTQNLTQNNHHYCLTPQALNTNYKLKDFYNILSYNKDRKGQIFISSMEAKDYPFFAVQFHPEKSVYDWDINVNVDHDDSAVRFAQYLANFFVQETRKSSHGFATPEAAAAMLIDNYNPIFTGAPGFYSEYYFNITKPQQTLYFNYDKNRKDADGVVHDQMSRQREEEDVLHYYSPSVTIHGKLMLQLFAIICAVTIFCLGFMVFWKKFHLYKYSVKVKTDSVNPDCEKLLIA